MSKIRKRMGAALLDGFFRYASHWGRSRPNANPDLHGVEVIRDVVYHHDGTHEYSLDVYRPIERSGSCPAVLYAHGGGFRILSKDTHWVMGLAFAKAGYVCFVFNYRLAPKHPYPAALEDASQAYQWMIEHGQEYDADLNRLVLAGESAGANLCLALTIAACFEREEAWAKAVFATGVVPRAIAPACGILQVSDVDRFHRRRPLTSVVRDRLHEVELAYLGRHIDCPPELADPLFVLEGGDEPARSLPACFIGCGSKDVLLDDSRRLAAAYRKRALPFDLRVYPGQPHAFHAFAFQSAAKKYWRQQFQFLEQFVNADQPKPLS